MCKGSHVWLLTMYLYVSTVYNLYVRVLYVCTTCSTHETHCKIMELPQLLAVGRPGQALHLLLERLGKAILGRQLPAVGHHRDGSDVHGALGAISQGLAALGVLGRHLDLHLEDRVRKHRLWDLHLDGLARQMAVCAHDLAAVLAGVGVVLLGEDGVGDSCLHGAGEQHSRRSASQGLLGESLDVLHVLVGLLRGGSVHTVQLRAACNQLVTVVGCPRKGRGKHATGVIHDI